LTAGVGLVGLRWSARTTRDERGNAEQHWQQCAPGAVQDVVSDVELHSVAAAPS
jgi:hypothetical protein